MRWIAMLLFAPVLSAQTIAVNTTSKLQTIDGFGASMAQQRVSYPNSTIDALWTTGGLGLSIVRTEIAPDYVDCIAYYGTGNCVPVASGATLTVWELSNLQRASADGAIVLASLWSPPTAMLSPGPYGTASTFNGTSGNYTALAAMEASYITLLTGTYGIPIYAISAQNEPDVPLGSGLQCDWSAQQIHDFVPYLASALATAGYSGTKIMIAEPYDWNPGPAQTAMNDSAVAAKIGILAGHAYSGSASGMSLASFSNVTNQHLWETEVSDFNPYDPSIASGLTYATQIHQWLTTAGVNAWNFWYGPYCTGCANDNEALTSPSNTLSMAKRGYAMGNWAKFVRPGWSMVSVSNSTGLLVTGFISADGKSLAIVAVNPSGSDVTNQSFSIGSFHSAAASPWITSGTYNLQSQAPVAISGSTFSYTIPALSVVTLVSVVSSSGSTLNGALTLSGAVQVN
jgi:glucuronoarabinoxylan endo-1,4-beta-xylanase